MEVASRLRECFSDRAAIIRLGGDEFVVLLEGVADAEDVGLIESSWLRSDRPS